MKEHEKRIREALEAGPVQYACHADGEVSQSCAFDAGQYLRDCRIAVRLNAKGQCKTDCEQWKPLNLNTSTVQVSADDLRALLADLDEARAALTAAKAGGWVAVPVEPTPEMIHEVEHASRLGAVWTAASVYKAMLAARPLPNPPKEQSAGGLGSLDDGA